jgi:hypothetical protein
MHNPSGWNATYVEGRPTGEHLCPDCQTPEENMQAELNAATLDYGQSYVDEEGRLVAARTQTEEEQVREAVDDLVQMLLTNRERDADIERLEDSGGAPLDRFLDWEQMTHVVEQRFTELFAIPSPSGRELSDDALTVHAAMCERSLLVFLRMYSHLFVALGAFTKLGASDLQPSDVFLRFLAEDARIRDEWGEL